MILKALLSIVLLFQLCGPTFADPADLNILMLYSNSGIYVKYGSTVPIIGKMWQEYVNTHVFNKLNIKANLIYEDVKSNAVLANQITTKYVTNNTVSAVFTPEGLLAGSVALTSYNLNPNMPLVAGMVGSSDVFICKTPVLAPCKASDGSRRFPNMIGVLTPGQQYFKPLFPLLKKKDYKTLAVMYINNGANIDVCTGSDLYADDYGLASVYTGIVTPGNSTYEDGQMKNHLENIKDLNPDTVLICYSAACSRFVNILYDINYLPKALGTFDCAGNITFIKDVGDKAKYIISPLQWDRRLQGFEYTEKQQGSYEPMFPSSKNQSSAMLMYNTFVENANGTEFSSLTASALASLKPINFAVTSCMNSLNSTSLCTRPDNLLSYMKNVYETSFFGIIANDFTTGLNPMKGMALVQIDSENQPQIISPDTSSIVDAVMPMPNWEERIYTHMMLNKPIEKALLAIVIICDIFALLIILFIILHRNNRLIKAMSIYFSSLIVVGYAMICTATLTWTLENNETSCGARVPTFIIGIILTLISLIAKNIRIALIFNTKNLKTKKITDWHVFGIFGILAFPLLLFMFLWIGIFPLELVTVQPDTLRPIFNYQDCSSGNYIFGILTLAYVFLLYIIAFIVSYKVSNAFSEFNEADVIAKSTYYSSVISIIIIIIQLAVNNDRAVTFAIRSFGIIFIFTTMIIILFSKKFSMVFKGNKVAAGSYLPTTIDESDDVNVKTSVTTKNTKIEIVGLPRNSTASKQSINTPK
jgi:hypothetical protein